MAYKQIKEFRDELAKRLGRPFTSITDDNSKVMKFNGNLITSEIEKFVWKEKPIGWMVELDLSIEHPSVSNSCVFLNGKIIDSYIQPGNSDDLIDLVNHPKHYTSHPSGVECIDITEHMTFNIGNAIKYMWRSGLKNENPVLQELKKAQWYLNREIKRLECSSGTQNVKD